MDDVMKGFPADFIATLVVTAMMTIKTHMEFAPEVDVIGILARVGEVPGQPWYGWLAYFAVGILLWGASLASHPTLCRVRILPRASTLA